MNCDSIMHMHIGRYADRTNNSGALSLLQVLAVLLEHILCNFSLFGRLDLDVLEVSLVHWMQPG